MNTEGEKNGKEAVFFNKRRKLGLFFLTVAAVSALMTLKTASAVYRFFCYISILCDILALYYILISRELKKKVIGAIEEIMLKITGVIVNFAKKIIEKLSLKSSGRGYGRAVRPGDYVDENIRIRGKTMARRRKKRKKYKDMDNVEKVRYMYEQKVTDSIKKGADIQTSMTPKEAGDVMVEERCMRDEGRVLIDIYNSARYDENAVITDNMVERVKKV